MITGMNGRPASLFPWFKDISGLKGVGPKLYPLLERLAGSRVKDLVFHRPATVQRRQHITQISDLEPGMAAIFTATVVRHDPPPRARLPYRVTVGDDSGYLTLVFFSVKGDYLTRQLPVDSQIALTGVVESYQGQLQMTHPELLGEADAVAIKTLEPIYPLTAGVTQKTLARVMGAAREAVTGTVLPEWLDKALMVREGWPAFSAALDALHDPDDTIADAHNSGELADIPALRRLAYDEALAAQLALGLVREKTKRVKGRSVVGDDRLIKQVITSLPYQLTGDQQACWRAISNDMAAPQSALRLIQGDVGSGKTVVALLAATRAKEAGLQTALLAPTEILARQHLKSFNELGAAIGLRVGFLSGRVKGKDRDTILDDLARGALDILIGTHAIIQDPVVFQDLGLAIIDEQHRFGVAQRLALSEKAPKGMDYLGLSATPIPRTLTLALNGDMDISQIIEKPPGRKPIETRVIPASRLQDVVKGIERRLKTGGQAYWVCPLIAESSALPAPSAEERYDSLKAIFGDQVGLLHGQLPGPEKERVIDAFKAGKLGLLVSTTVIEVGVDVPNASVMVIEGADRFGLAQLHQLRGRVGRGDVESACLLIRSESPSAVARERLTVIRSSDDGFYISEQDLRLRGAGEMLGTRQSGLPESVFLDYASHADLLSIARDDARLMIDRDADLLSERGQALRTLLYLFEKDAAVRYLRSG